MTNYISRRAIAAATVALGLCVIQSPSVFANAALEKVYKGKRVTITVGFDAGGTYGLYAQLFARHMAQNIPGNPTMVVQYMPGAGGMKASNYAYNAMPRNGLNLFVPPDTIVITNLLDPNKARYDARKFNWLGTAVQTNAVLVLRSDKGIKTLADLKTIPANVGSTGTGSQTFLIPAMLNGLFGTKLKIIQGYTGSQKTLHAIEKKELDGASLTWGAWKASRPDWFKNGYATRILQVGINTDPDLKDVPVLLSLAPEGETRQIVSFMSSLGAVGRGLVLPPNTPRNVANMMRQAFQQSVNGANFRTDAAKRNLDVNPLKGEELEKIVNEMMSVDKSVVAKARNLIMVKGRKGN